MNLIRAKICTDTATEVDGAHGRSAGTRRCERLIIEGCEGPDKRIAIYREGSGPKPWFLRWNYEEIEVQIGEFNQTQMIWVNKNSLRKRFHEIKGDSPKAIIDELRNTQIQKARERYKKWKGENDKIRIGVRIAQATASLHAGRILYRPIQFKKVASPYYNHHLIDFSHTRPKLETSNLGACFTLLQGTAPISHHDYSVIQSNDPKEDNFSLGRLLLDLYRDFFIQDPLRVQDVGEYAPLSQNQLEAAIEQSNIPEWLLDAFRGLLSTDPKTRMTAQQAADSLAKILKLHTRMELGFAFSSMRLE